LDILAPSQYLKPAVDARKAAEKAYKASKNDAVLKRAYEKPMTHKDRIRGAVEHAQESLAKDLARGKEVGSVVGFIAVSLPAL
jgi:hypothetical protein